MEYIKCDIPGPVVIRPAVHRDARGYFMETFRLDEFRRNVADVEFVQDNESCSCSRGVVRGLHFQAPPFAQAKLVRCVEGRVLDVAVDIRRGSPTFGRHIAVELSADNHLQLFIPRGFAHGFAVLSERAIFQYKCDNYYSPSSEGGLSLADPALGIDWQVDLSRAILSAKDSAYPAFKDFKTPFTF